MAWAPSTNFEDDLVDLQPDFNLIHGQLAYEQKQKQNSNPRPKSTYEYLGKREKRNEQIRKEHPSKTKEIAANLAMMERIQEIAGTKPLGEHASMSDWDDESTVEQEAIAMMRHFGMMSMADGSLLPPKKETFQLPPGGVHILRNGSKCVPLSVDPSYFEPGGTRKKSHLKSNTNTSQSSSSNTYENAESGSSISNYSTAKSNLDDTVSSLESSAEIQYTLLETSAEEIDNNKTIKNNTYNSNYNNNRGNRRPNQKQRKRNQNFQDY